jgi:hypothetical protein
MADETPVAPAPAETPATPAPPPPSAPPTETRPTMTPEAAQPAADQFSAMEAMLGRPSVDEASEAAKTLAARRRREPERARESAPVAPAPPPAPVPPPGPRRYAGIYETPDALEEAYKRLDGDKQRAEQAAQRLERLLLSSLEGARAHPPGTAPGPAPAPPAPHPAWTSQLAQAAIREEAARLALEDPAADPQRFIRAIAAALREDEEARGLYIGPAVQAIQQQADHQQQIATLQQAFFTQYPDLKAVRPELLRQVALETEARLARAAPESYGSPAYLQQWFEETAREARTVFRVPSASGPDGSGTASGPAPGASGPPTAPAAKPQGAPFAETPSPRPSEPALTGQALHLHRVFGRGG